MSRLASLFLALFAAFALALPAAASASTTLGPANPNPDPLAAQAIQWPGTTLFLNTSAPAGVQLKAPFDGVATGLRLFTDQVGAGVTLRVRTMAPAGGLNYTAIASSPPMPVAEVNPSGADDKNALHTFVTHVPVVAGQLVGFSTSKPEGAQFRPVTPYFENLNWKSACFGGGCTVDPAPADGTSAEAFGRADNFWWAYSVEIEADADGDLQGDESQDNCPGVANADQADADADGSGDACDRDPAPNVITVPGPERVVAVPGTERVVTVTPSPKAKKCPKGKKPKKGRCVKKKGKGAR